MTAAPTSRHATIAGTVRHRREYRDALGRAMTGTVKFTGSIRHEQGQQIVVPAGVDVQVVGGVLEVDLPPDTYAVRERLSAPDGDLVSNAYSLTLPVEGSPAPSPA